MSIQFLLVENEKRMEIYDRGNFLADYPLFSSEVDFLKQEGVTGIISKDLVSQICGAPFLRVIRKAITVGKEGDEDNPLFEFPHEL